MKGGGIYCYGYAPTIFNNTISNNSTQRGGGIYCYIASPIISNNTISNNSVSYDGGGVYCEDSYKPKISNNTISNNTALRGGALFCTVTSMPDLRNTLIWGNTATTTGNQVYLNDETSDPNFYFCDVQGGKAAFGLNSNIFYTGSYSNNIDIDPSFVSPSAGGGTSYDGLSANWSIQSGSPCINAGDPSGTYPSNDKAGNLRVSCCRIDIGAYEFVCGSIALSNTIITTNVSCSGDSNGIAAAIASGGTLAYSYTWNTSPEQNTSSATGLIAGTYNVTVTDSNSCTITTSATISEPDSINISKTVVKDTCLPCNTGQIELTVTGGTPPFNYLWFPNTNETTNKADSLKYGNYSVTISDKNNCTYSIDFIKVDSVLVTISPNEIINDFIKVFPNPTNDILNIEVSNPGRKDVKIFINNLLNQPLVHKKIDQPEKNVFCQFNLNEYPKQIYFIKINLDDKWLYYKIAVVK